MAGRLKLMGSAHYQNDGDPRTSGPGFRLTVHDDALGIPLRWTRPRLIFVDSMSDLFHADVPEEFICKVWTVMRKASQHTFQILTKRPQRMADVVSRIAWRAGLNGYEAYMWDGPGVLNQAHAGGPEILPNVWIGTSIENDKYSFRANYLRATPAAVRWVSAEPLIGPLDSLDLTGIDWVVVGSESGPSHRPTDLRWVRDLRDRCASRTRECTNGDLCARQERNAITSDEPGRHPNPVAFFVKQLPSGTMRPLHDITEFPDGLQIQEYPREETQG